MGSLFFFRIHTIESASGKKKKKRRKNFDRGGDDERTVVRSRKRRKREERFDGCAVIIVGRGGVTRRGSRERSAGNAIVRVYRQISLAQPGH